MAVERYPIGAKELALPLTLLSTKSQHIHTRIMCRVILFN